jgi:mannosyltransferase
MTTLDARSTRSAGRVARWSSSLRVGPTAAVVGGLAMVVTWLGSWNPSYWGDEAATVVSANRPIGVLLAELGNIDAVHGLYYLAMHFWIGLFGASELSTRAPSAIAVGLLVAGTVVLGARLAGLRFGLLAGIVCAILPRTTFLATEARSYAIGTAIAVWITVSFVGLLRRRETRLRSWLVLGALVGLASYLFLYLALLAAVFGVVLLTSTSNRRHLGRWIRSLVVTGVVAAPIVLLAYLERGQVAFLAVRGYATPGNVILSQWFGDLKVGGNLLVPTLGWALILLGTVLVIVRTARRSPTAVLENRTSDRDTVRLGVAWLVIPTAVLLAGNAWVSPMYNVRYLSFSTPAVALLIAVGLVAAGRLAARGVLRLRDLRTGDRAAVGRRATIAVAAILLLALGGASLPGFLAQRGPYAKNGGSDWRQVADYIQANASAGDAVIFDPTTKPSKRPELAYRMYPQQFAAVDAVAVQTPYFERAHLWDVVAPLAEVRSDLARSTSVWALELPVGTEVPEDIADLTSHGYRVVSSHLVHHTEIYQLQKENS